MILLLEFGESLCYARTFVINGVVADSNDFGDQYDRDQENAEDYGCGNMQFTRKPSTPFVLGKYSIGENEYSEVCGRLEEGLSFGDCGWCV